MHLGLPPCVTHLMFNHFNCLAVESSSGGAEKKVGGGGGGVCVLGSHILARSCQ